MVVATPERTPSPSTPGGARRQPSTMEEHPVSVRRGADGFYGVVLGITDDRRHVVVAGNAAQNLLRGDEITMLNKKPTAQFSHQALIRRIRGRDHNDAIVKRYPDGHVNLTLSIRDETSLCDPTRGALTSAPLSPAPTMTAPLPGAASAPWQPADRGDAHDARNGYIAINPHATPTTAIPGPAHVTVLPTSRRNTVYSDLDNRSSSSSFEAITVRLGSADSQTPSSPGWSTAAKSAVGSGGSTYAWSSNSSVSSIPDTATPNTTLRHQGWAGGGGGGNGIAPTSAVGVLAPDVPLVGTGAMRMSELEEENGRLVRVVENMQVTASEFMSKLTQAEAMARGQVSELQNTNAVLSGELAVAHSVMQELQEKIISHQEELAAITGEPTPSAPDFSSRFLPPTAIVWSGAGASRAGGEFPGMVSPEDEMHMPFDKTVQVDDNDPHTELLELLNELKDFDAENETLKMQNQTLRHTSSHQAHTLGGATRLTESVTMEVITNNEGHLDFTVVNDPDGGAVVGIVDDGSPADFTGLIAGCRFEKVNGLDVITSTADEVLTMLTQVEGLNCEIVVTRGVSRMLMMPKVLDTSLGFRMDGQSKQLKGDLLQPHVDNIYIVQVDQHSPADIAGMKAGDRVMWINGTATTAKLVPHVVSMITGADEAVVMRVVHDPVGMNRQKRSKRLAKEIRRRSTYNKKQIRKVEIIRDAAGSFGLKLKGPRTEDIAEHQTIAGVHVSEVAADQAAEAAGLQVSDRILVANGTSCQGMGFAEVASLFKGKDKVVLKVISDISGFKANLRAIGEDTDWVDLASPRKSLSGNKDPTSPATEIIAMAVNEFHTSLSFGGE